MREGGEEVEGGRSVIEADGEAEGLWQGREGRRERRGE